MKGEVHTAFVLQSMDNNPGGISSDDKFVEYLRSIFKYQHYFTLKKLDKELEHGYFVLDGNKFKESFDEVHICTYRRNWVNRIESHSITEFEPAPYTVQI